MPETNIDYSINYVKCIAKINVLLVRLIKNAFGLGFE